MADSIRVLVVGLDHWIQRHQDPCPERVAARAAFEHTVRTLVERDGIQLVAEEAGGAEVVSHLQDEENRWAPYENRPPVTVALATIAQTAVAPIRSCRYVDIRPPGDWVHREPDNDYEQAMIARMLAEMGSARTILVLCGADHRWNLWREFSQRHWNVDGPYNVDDKGDLVREEFSGLISP